MPSKGSLRGSAASPARQVDGVSRIGGAAVAEDPRWMAAAREPESQGGEMFRLLIGWERAGFCGTRSRHVGSEKSAYAAGDVSNPAIHSLRRVEWRGRPESSTANTSRRTSLVSHDT